MKKLIIIIVLFVGLLSYGQGGSLIDALKFRGEVTTVIRDTFDVPLGQNWIIYNVTTQKYETSGSDDVWTEFRGTTPTLAEVLTSENTSGGNQITMLDNDALNIGTGSDLKIVHNGANTYFDSYTSQIVFRDADNAFAQDFVFNFDTGEIVAGGVVLGTDDQTASEVPITDAGGLTTTTNVEDYLAENRGLISNNIGDISALDADKLGVFSTSAQLATVLTDETGSGGGFVRATSPTVSSLNASNYIRMSNPAGFWDLGRLPYVLPTGYTTGDFFLGYEDGAGSGWEKYFLFTQLGELDINGKSIRNNLGTLQFENASNVWTDFGGGTSLTKATTSEAEAGVEDTHYMTAAKTKQAIDALAPGGTLTAEQIERIGNIGKEKIISVTSNTTLSNSNFEPITPYRGMKTLHTSGGDFTVTIPAGLSVETPTNFKIDNIDDILTFEFDSGVTIHGRDIDNEVLVNGFTLDSLERVTITPLGSDVFSVDGYVKTLDVVTDPMLHASLAIRLDDTSIDATATVEGDPVGLWTDIVSGHNATSSTVNRPSLHIVGGQRTVSFDGTDEFLGIAAANVNYVKGDEVTIMIELADIVPDNNVGTNYILSKGGFNQTTNHQYTIFGSANLTRFNAFGNTTTTATDFIANQVLTLKIKATTFDAFMNGTKVATDIALTNAATFSVDLILGGNNAGLDNNGTFSMQGMYIYESALTDTEITDRVTYLNAN